MGGETKNKAPYRIGAVPEKRIEKNALFVTALGLLAAMSAIAVDIALPATPSLEEAFAINAERAQFVITAYIAGMSIGFVPIGLLADRYGRRPVILTSVCLFILAGAASLAPLSFPVLLGLRFFQGFWGAVGPALSRAIVRDLDGPETGARLMSIITAILSVAPLAGPLLGGILTESLGWRAPFWSSAIYGAVAFAAIFVWLPETMRCGSKHSVFMQVKHALSIVAASARAKTGMALFTLPFIGYFAFLTSLSAVMYDTHSVSPGHFGILFAISASPYFLGALLTRRLLTDLSEVQVLSAGMLVLFSAGLMIIALIFWTASPAWALWLAFSFYLLGMAMCLPITTMEALSPLAGAAAFGASLLGTLQIGVGAVGSFLSAYFYNGAKVSMCLVASLSSICAALIFILRKKTLFKCGK